MLARWLMRLYIAGSVLAVVGGLGAMYVAPPPGMRYTAEGVPYLLPSVEHPQTGEAIPLETLILHYRKGGR